MLRNKARVALFALLAASAVSAQDIQTIPLGDLGLSSIRSALWVEERSAVILVDTIGRRVVEVELRESGSIVPRKAPPALFPTFIGKASNRFIQLARDKKNGSLQEIHWFDRNLVRKGVTKVVPAKTVGGIRTPVEDSVVGLFSWILAGREDTIFAYGVLDAGARMESQNPYTFGFFTYKLKSLESRAGVPKADLVETFAEFDYYRLGYPYLVAFGYEVYYLEMGVHPALKHYDTEQGGRPIYLDGLPESSMPLPRIYAATPDTSALFGKLETLEMPAGLYGDGGFLYLLRRRPDDSGVTEWTLTKLQPEPENRRVQDLGTVHLRTKAPHLNVLFTRRSVLVFEKSSVPEGSRAQHVMAVQVVPKFWVTDPGRSPLREE